MVAIHISCEKISCSSVIASKYMPLVVSVSFIDYLLSMFNQALES
jgi:hypothetical protein